MITRVAHSSAAHSIENWAQRLGRALFGAEIQALILGGSSNREESTWIEVSKRDEPGRSFFVSLPFKRGTYFYGEALSRIAMNIIDEGNFQIKPASTPKEAAAKRCVLVGADISLAGELCFLGDVPDTSTETKSDPRVLTAELQLRVEKSSGTRIQVRRTTLRIGGRSFKVQIENVRPQALIMSMELHMNKEEQEMETYPLDLVIRGISLSVSDLLRLRPGSEIQVENGEPFSGEIRCGGEVWGEVSICFIEKNQIAIEVTSLALPGSDTTFSSTERLSSVEMQVGEEGISH